MIARLIERSRFGAWLIAVRENEDAAKALGVDATQRQARRHGHIRRHYRAPPDASTRNIFCSSISGIAYGTWISIEALLTPIIGGVGTVFGPLLGALVVKSLGEGAKLVTGDVPGLDLDRLWRRACAGHLVYAARPDRRLCAGAQMADAPCRAGRCRRSRRRAMAEPLLVGRSRHAPLRRPAGRQRAHR